MENNYEIIGVVKVLPEKSSQSAWGSLMVHVVLQHKLLHIQGRP